MSLIKKAKNGGLSEIEKLVGILTIFSFFIQYFEKNLNKIFLHKKKRQNFEKKIDGSTSLGRNVQEERKDN